MPERVDPGHEVDTADYRHRRPPTPCEGRVPPLATPNGVPRWCPGFIDVWQRRFWGQRYLDGPDGWWAWGEFQLEAGKRWRGWLHETEVRPRRVPDGSVAVRGRGAYRRSVVEAARPDPRLPLPAARHQLRLETITLPRDPHPPGWYTDPENPLVHRWWTGDAWLTQAEHIDAAKPDTEAAQAPDV